MNLTFKIYCTGVISKQKQIFRHKKWSIILAMVSLLILIRLSHKSVWLWKPKHVPWQAISKLSQKRPNKIRTEGEIMVLFASYFSSVAKYQKWFTYILSCFIYFFYIYWSPLTSWMDQNCFWQLSCNVTSAWFLFLERAWGNKQTKGTIVIDLQTTIARRNTTWNLDNL